MQSACEINTHFCQLLSRIVSATLKYGERGEHMQTDRHVKMSVYFTHTGTGVKGHGCLQMAFAIDVRTGHLWFVLARLCAWGVSPPSALAD